MRMKQFLIFWVIFTIVYIVFFIVYDRVSRSLADKKKKKRALSSFQTNSYQLFSQFYGISGTANIDTLLDIYLKYQNVSKIFFTNACGNYRVDPYEFCVIILYLEYLHLFPSKMIQYESGLINSISFQDASLISKYQNYFKDHLDYQSIFSICGECTMTDLTYIDHNFLAPGVRFVNGTLFYVGDLHG